MAMRGKLWVQVWTAPVAGGVEISEEDLRAIKQFEHITAMIPLMTKISDEFVFVDTNQVKAPRVSLNELEELYESLEPWKD
jgi:predicted NUDIX family phosphoesterase